MNQKRRSRFNRKKPKTVHRLPDLEHAKAAVLNSLTSADARRGYRHAIDEFVDWYCSEPRLAFNRIVVLRYRGHLESRQLAPGTINVPIRPSQFEGLARWLELAIEQISPTQRGTVSSGKHQADGAASVRFNAVKISTLCGTRGMWRMWRSLRLVFGSSKWPS
jgi:hypothetical protein